MTIPIHGHMNAAYFFKIEAKKIGITGGENAIIRKLKKQRPELLYRILPHSSTAWYERIKRIVNENDLVGLTEAQLAAEDSQNATLNQPEAPLNPPNAIPIVLQADTAVQTNIALSQCFALSDRIANQFRTISTLMKTPSLDIDRIQEIRDKINQVPENITLLRQLSVEANSDFTENLNKMETKMLKIQQLYQTKENKSRTDLLQYIRTLDNSSDSSVTDQEIDLAKELLQTVDSYQLLFGSDFPDDVAEKVEMLQTLSIRKRRSSKNQEDVPIKRQKK